MLTGKRKPTKLKLMLVKMDITQRQLARATDKEYYQISEWVSGKKKDMLLSTAKTICRVMECSLDELFGDD